MIHTFLKPFFLMFILVCSIACSMNGCGYGFQGSKSPFLIKQGIKSIYIAPFANGTYKPGVETVVYNHLTRVILAHRRVKIVHDKEDADAVLEGNVFQASNATTASTPVSILKPEPVGRGLIQGGRVVPGTGIPNQAGADYGVATEYTAYLSCSFKLSRFRRKQVQTEVIWNGSFSRNKPYPGANQLDVPGTTSVQINESEFDRALSDLSRSMMESVHEAMLAMF